MSHAAVRAIQYYPEIKSYYQRLARRKPPVVARALVAKELARIVYFMLKNKTVFDPERLVASLSRDSAH